MRSSPELRVIDEVSSILGRALKFERALDEVLKVLYSYWNARYSYIAFIESPDKLRIVRSFGINEEFARNVVFGRGEGVVGKVFKDGVPVVLSDVKLGVFLNKTGMKDRLREGETFIAVPVLVESKVVGVLAVFKDFSKESIEKAVGVLKVVASMLGMLFRLEQFLKNEQTRWEEEKQALKSTILERERFDAIIGKSPAIEKLFEVILKLAKTEANVLITGESGTGKGLVARALHFLGPRREGPFLIINCSAIPESLLEAELFGFERGAFTGAYSTKRGKFELASGGTIFLDEIADMPLSLQPKLLRVLQEREFERLGSEKSIRVDVRVASATNKDLNKLISQGSFREDLYYRLNVVPIRVPALRERKEDIPLLVEHFIKVHGRRYGKKVSISASVMEAFLNYPWPGNVRELENTIERLVILKDGVIQLSDLPAYMRTSIETGFSNFDGYNEAELIKLALEKAGFVKSRAAKLLGLTLRQLDYRIKKYNIQTK
ncbi:MAG: sigma 54-interacting transcriptional regulator [Aquificaceae bacterium]|nr:sigma 54-interacting transcriptional regulator [Aquificaceae bacterium]MDW8236795.1 sigma 54-interacting transcriptional regulator [Aquificaceae bacterium]